MSRRLVNSDLVVQDAFAASKLQLVFYSILAFGVRWLGLAQASIM